MHHTTTGDWSRLAVVASWVIGHGWPWWHHGRLLATAGRGGIAPTARTTSLHGAIDISSRIGRLVTAGRGGIVGDWSRLAVVASPLLLHFAV